MTGTARPATGTVRARTDPAIPHDESGEAGALACILSAVNGQSEKMLDELVEADFHEQKHLTVFRALLQLQLDSRPFRTGVGEGIKV